MNFGFVYASSWLEIYITQSGVNKPHRENQMSHKNSTGNPPINQIKLGMVYGDFQPF
jgi:hypothetical protein